MAVPVPPASTAGATAGSSAAGRVFAASAVSQAIAVHLLHDGDRIRRLRRREVAERFAVLQDLLQRGLPDWNWRRPEGGLTVWARLPDGSSSDFAQIARRYGVLIAPGPVMSAAGRFDGYVRLPFDYQPETLREGIGRLARAWQEYRSALEAHGPRQVDVIV